MTEKYKIYLSEDTRSRLMNDAELFEFTKRDGSVNLNAFLKVLIVNYFDQYRRESESLMKDIIRDMKAVVPVKDKDAERLAEKIVSTYIRNDDAKSGKNSAVTLTVSGESFDVIRTIENNMLKDTSLSQYLKDMFGSYLSIPRSSREMIIFEDTYKDLTKALNEHKVLTFVTTNTYNRSFTVEPYIIAPSKEEQCNYLLCRDIKTRTPRTFRISRIRSAFVTAKDFTPDPELEKELHTKAVRSPHSVSLNVEAQIRLSEYGIRKFKMVTKNRPAVSKTEGDIYYFDWPEIQLEEYFKRFGKDAVVLKPLSLRNKLKNYYESALKAYR